jgi:uncharacterized protein YndB with AHSA1/START domain
MIAAAAAAAVVVLVAAVLVYAATRPDTFRIERAAQIQAPPEKVFALIDDPHAWNAWSPWEKLDPAQKRTFSGAASGEGAAYAWEGNSKVGAGRMEITKSSPSSKVVIKLDFIRPFEGHNVAEFDLEPRGDSTKVTWAMSGPKNFFVKVIGVVIDMDGMLGKEFENGLANMKAAAEKGSTAAR